MTALAQEIHVLVYTNTLLTDCFAIQQLLARGSEFNEHWIIPETSQVLRQIRNLRLMDEPRFTVTKYQSMEKQS